MPLTTGNHVLRAAGTGPAADGIFPATAHLARNDAVVISRAETEN